MKVIHLHQRYRIRGGEDAMVEATVALLVRRGVQASLITRDSAAIAASLPARARAFIGGVYSFSAAAWMRRLLNSEHPDVVHIHNLHPSFSPAVIPVCRRAGVPVVMTCHNYRLVCPTGMFMRGGRVCDACCGGREYRCLLYNCRGSLVESAAYALRNTVHRMLGLYRDHVSRFIAISGFVRDRLVAEGFPPDRFRVIPNMASLPDSGVDCAGGSYAAFAGRFSPQKGIATLLAAATCTGIPVRLAGNHASMPELIRMLPPNAQLAGRLAGDAMADFYRRARFAVVPSECPEPFGLVAVEAMGHGLPVIAARTGGLPEVVEDGVTGLLFQPGSAADLAAKMKRLWDDPDLCRALGAAARERAAREFNEDLYYRRLMNIYAELAPEAA